jgi:antibiotic biosynthesis monooxygenase (ABM) superfamily enzyme
MKSQNDRGSPAPAVRPARWKMAIVTSIAIYPLLVVLIPLFRPVTSGQPNSIAVIPVILVAVPIMTWVMMPLLTWLLGSWLVPRPRSLEQSTGEPPERR